MDRLRDLCETKTCWNWMDSTEALHLTIYIETQAEADYRSGATGAFRGSYFLIREQDRDTDTVYRASQNLGNLYFFGHDLIFLNLGYYCAYLISVRSEAYPLFKDIYQEINAYPPSDAPTALISPKFLPCIDGIYDRNANNIRLLKQLR